MYIRTWEKGDKVYASVVRSYREENKVKQKTVCYLGLIDKTSVPYLKAAFAKDKPKLVYKDGTTYEP